MNHQASDGRSRYAEALIGISHPDFRGELLASAKKRCYAIPGRVEA